MNKKKCYNSLKGSSDLKVEKYQFCNLRRARMGNYKDLVEIMLPEGLLNSFDYKGISKSPDSYKITLEQKNKFPKLPVEYSDKQVTSKGFKNITINDFPLRGRKVILLLRRRVWKIEGVKKLFKNDLSLTLRGTKLEKEFAAFLKGID